MIYRYFYSYAMGICKRYSNNNKEAVEILNEGFLNIFKKIHHHKGVPANVVSSFRGWLRGIMIETTVGYFKKYYRHERVIDPDNTIYQLTLANENVVEKLSHEKTIEAIRNLSPLYRTIFNLFVIEGLDHDVIAKKLEISVSASKLNLSKARKHLENILGKQNNFSLGNCRIG